MSSPRALRWGVGPVTFLDLEHAADCPSPSAFYEVRGGWAWLACRRCGVTAVRPPSRPAAPRTITVRNTTQETQQ